MSIIIKLLTIIVSIVFTTTAKIPQEWKSSGIGGGGSLFSPSINPANADEFYVGCDMSELFHSTDFGVSITTEPFYQIQGGHNSSVQYTSNPLVRYCISYANDMAVPVKSTDGGVTWAKLSGNPDESEETFSIFADYNHPERLVISYYGLISYSADGGKSFKSIRTAQNSGSGIVLGGAFFTGDTIVLGTSEGLVLSTDGGSHFALTAFSGIPQSESIFSFAGAKQGNTIRFFCLTGNTAEMYVGLTGTDYYEFAKGIYSMDWNGTSAWVSRLDGINLKSDFPMYVAMAANNIDIAYCAGSSASGEPLVLKTQNGGTNWSAVFKTTANENITTGWSGSGGDRGWGYGECVFGIGVCQTDANRIIISDMGFIHTSTDGAKTWQQAYLARSDQNASGKATPQKKSYHSNGLENTSVWQIFWSDSSHLFAAYTDIRGARSTDAGASWSFDYSGYTANTMYRIVKNSSGNLYAATSGVHDMYQSTRLADAQLDSSDAGGNIIYSSNHGATWQNLHSFNHPVYWVELDPNDQNTLYASVIHSSQGGIYVSHNIQSGSSSTWTRLPVPDGTQGHPACIKVLKDGSVLCTYSGRRTNSGFTPSSGAFVYTPSTNSWANVSSSGMKYWTKDIVVDPSDPSENTWYCCVFSGWGGAPNGLGGLYKTVNRGAQWTRICNSDRVTSITINPKSPAEAYFTTESQGLWYSSNLTSNSPVFTRVDNYPFRQPERVFFNPYQADEIWVTSFGNGLRVGNTNAAVVTPALNLHHRANEPFAYYTKGKIVIRGLQAHLSQQKISVVSISGKTLYQNVFNAEKFTSTVELNSGILVPGTYFISIGIVAHIQLTVAE